MSISLKIYPSTIERIPCSRSLTYLSPSYFTPLLYFTIDLDGSGAIDFEEYICVMATYCMYSKNEIMRFCFDCFDVDGSGELLYKIQKHTG